MAWDDTRDLGLEIADQVKVLVVGEDGAAGASATPRARSAAYYMMAALAPFEGTKGADGKPLPWSVKPVYRGAGAAAGELMGGGYAAVFMCDVPRVPAGMADPLAAFVKGGGRLVWVLGPGVDAAAYNGILLSGPRALLPAPLKEPVNSARAQPLDWVDARSGVFMNLFDSQEPFRNVLVTARWALEENAAGGNGRTLARLADGSPLFLQHGNVYTLLTTPGAEWSNLGATVLLVPLASRMALGDFQPAGGGEACSFETGQAVPVRAPGAVRGVSLDVTLPEGGVVNVKAGAAAGEWTFTRAQTAGVYAWKSSDEKQHGEFVVNPPGEEAELLPANVMALARESSGGEDERSGRGTIVAYSVPEMLGQLTRRAEGTSLMPGFLSMVLLLAVVEAMLANRQRG
jgi:hypothetical protein